MGLFKRRTKARIKWRGDTIAVEEAISRELETVRAATPDNPTLHGFKVFSQCDEDGILAHLLALLPEDSRTNTCLEIGCGFGLENNTHHLLLQGFRGVWVDADAQHIESIHAALGASLDHPASPLRVTQCFVDRDNIKPLVADSCAFLGTEEVDVFSLDIDGNDLWVAERALECFRPALVIVEYNAKLRPPLSRSVRYEPRRVWDGRGDYQGASLSAFVEHLDGYRLACCGISGVNAFFVRRDLAEYVPSTGYSTELLYRPMRHPFCGRPGGHEPTLGWLRDVLDERVAAAGG